MSDSPSDPMNHFSLVVGGPFHSILYRIGALADDGLPTPRVAMSLAALAWLLPAALVAAQSWLDEGYSGWSYFSDSTAAARYLIAIFVMLATERYADGRIDLLIEQFRGAQIVDSDHEAAFRDAVARADRQTSSSVAEGVIAAIALAWAAAGTRIAAGTVASAWEGAAIADGVALSWAGTLASLVSTPLFVFLALRWIWRSVVWMLLLARFSRLPLNLTPLHPDRCAGLGFLSIYPSVFTGFVFALSSCVAATLIRELESVDFSTDDIRWMLAGWVALVLVLFIGPVSVFVPVLRNARETALLEYGRLAHLHHLAFRRKWLESGRSAEELIGSSDLSSASDLNQCLTAVHEMRIFPVDRFALVQLLGATAIPLLAVVLTRVPMGELLRRLGLGFL